MQNDDGYWSQVPDYGYRAVRAGRTKVMLYDMGDVIILKALSGIQGMINLDELQVDPALMEKFRQELTQKNSRYWVNVCLKLHNDYELKKQQAE